MFRNFTGKLGAFSSPGPKCTSEAVCCNIAPSHSLKALQHCHMLICFDDVVPENTKGLDSNLSTDSNNATTLGAKGTTCSRPIFIRDAGMVQMAFFKSNSSHRAPMTLAVLHAVSIANSSARAEAPAAAESLRINPGVC
jgi:hypothetical protein